MEILGARLGKLEFNFIDILAKLIPSIIQNSQLLFFGLVNLLPEVTYYL